MRINILGFVTVGVLSCSTAAWADAAADCEKLYNAEDYKKAFMSCTGAAAQGDDNAQLRLGGMYENGEGVVQDYAEVVRWYKLAAAQGNVIAQFNLGWIYMDGTRVSQDYVVAHMWYNLAAAKGVSIASIFRKDVARLMTPAQIAEAQQRAQTCLANNYKNC